MVVLRWAVVGGKEGTREGRDEVGRARAMEEWKRRGDQRGLGVKFISTMVSHEGVTVC
jgi:hypothetical protein